MDAFSPQEMKAMRRNAAKAAALLKSLSHPARLTVLCELVAGETAAGSLVESSGLSQSALSQHLARLRRDGLVQTRREGQTIYYSLARGDAARVLATLHDIYCKRG